MTRLQKWLLATCGAVLVLVASLIGWQRSRDRALIAFCKQAHVGLSLPALFDLEHHHGIDESFLVQARFKDFIDQAHTPNLEFRSQPSDPDFACAIGHDGHTVTSVQILRLDGVEIDQ